MKRTLRLAWWAGLPTVLLAVGAGCNLSQPGGARLNDGDDDEKGGDGCKYITDQSVQSFQESPIPAGFFDFDGRACDAFSGVITYTGRPIDAVLYGQADTIVSRDDDPVSPADPVGTERTVGIDLAALNLESTEPITVFCDGAPTHWDVRLGLSDTAPPPGSVTTIKEHADGGTATSVLYVYPRLTFTYANDTSVVRVLDTAADGLPPVRFDATFPWSHAPEPNDPDPSAHFRVGVDNSSCVRHQSPDGHYVHEMCAIGVDTGDDQRRLP